jgi:hypothetical protein
MSSDEPQSAAATVIGAVIAGILLVLVFLGVRACFGADQAPRNADLRIVAPRDPVVLCRNAIRAAANYPGTVRFPFAAHDRDDRANGLTVIQQPFSATNGFGVPSEFRATCEARNGLARVTNLIER